MGLLITLQIFSCFFMTGVIWLVQILVYPGFRQIQSTDLRAVHGFHTNRITWVVAPVMLIELMTGAGICWLHLSFEFATNLSLIILIWILTAFVSVPFHSRLPQQPSPTINLLILTNWPRTMLWTLRSMFWIYFVLNKLIP